MLSAVTRLLAGILRCINYCCLLLHFMCLELTEKDVDGRSRACCLAIASLQQFLVPGCNRLETNLLKLVSLVNCSRKLKPSMLIPN